MGIRPSGQLWTVWAKRREGGLCTSLALERWGLQREVGGPNPRVPDGLAREFLTLEGVEMGPMPWYRQAGQMSRNGCVISICVWLLFLSWKWPYWYLSCGTKDGPGSRRQCGSVDGGGYS